MKPVHCRSHTLWLYFPFKVQFEQSLMRCMGGQHALKFSVWFIQFINRYSSPYLSRHTTLWARGLLCKRCQTFEVQRRQMKIHVQWGHGDYSYRHLLVVSSLYLKQMCICLYLYYWIWLVYKLLGEQTEICSKILLQCTTNMSDFT